MFTNLIRPKELLARQDDPGLVIIDCRFSLQDTEQGEREYETSHIPGAVYAHLDRDLSGAVDGTNGRHPLPESSAFAEKLGAMGVTRESQVVAYDQNSGLYASRLWWMVRWMGGSAAAVLDGGFDAWIAAGGPTVSGTEAPRKTIFDGNCESDMAVGPEKVASVIGDDGWKLIDARGPERYRGKTEPLDRVAGHIPSALNHHFQRNLDGGAFRPATDLKAALAPLVGGTPGENIVVYCGSGVSACHNLLALDVAGIDGAKLYPGSWSEWSSDPRRPVADECE